MSRFANIEIQELDGVEIALEPWSWPFAAARRDEIEAHFAGLQRQRPALWNGRVLLLRHYAIHDRILRGACFETDYASFLTWREWGFPDAGVYNFFAAAVLRAADGAYLAGEMAPHTAGAGQLYFPCGTPEPQDLDAGRTVDLRGHLKRELLEETGLDIGELDAEAGWSLVRDRSFLALMKRLTSRHTAAELRSRIMRHLASEAQPEFTDIRIIRGPADLDPRMPDVFTAFLEAQWRR